MKQLPESVAKALAGFEVDDKGALKKIKFEKLRALENLAKHYGVVAPDNSPQNIVINMSDEQIRRMEDILASMPNGDFSPSKPSIDVTLGQPIDVVAPVSIPQQPQETVADEVPADKGLPQHPPSPAPETRAEREERIAAMIERQNKETQEQRESRLVHPRCQHAPGTFCSLCVVDYATGVLEAPETPKVKAPETPTPPAAKPPARDIQAERRAKPLRAKPLEARKSRPKPEPKPEKRAFLFWLIPRRWRRR